MSAEKILLLEGIHADAKQLLETAGFAVELLPKSLPEPELIDALGGVVAVGLRSKTHLTENVLRAANDLRVAGCFCIGTNQVDLDVAHDLGKPVFNSPFSNTRSVAELVMAEIVFLARRIGDRNNEMHHGEWHKTADRSFEVRGKTLGIVGYGHIGRQVGVLAEAFGLNVIFHDIIGQLPMGNNRSVDSLDEVLSQADFVTLHVPATPETENMIGAEQIGRMKDGGYLLNLSRGNVVVIEDLVGALRSGHLSGAALDVYPEEPSKSDSSFDAELGTLPNVILTPHIGGSTQEAQVAIAHEVSRSLIAYLEHGRTLGAVNFPQTDLHARPGTRRVQHIHQNRAGVLGDVHRIVASHGANILGQVLETDATLGYLLMDLDVADVAPILADLGGLSTTLDARLLS